MQVSTLELEIWAGAGKWWEMAALPDLVKTILNLSNCMKQGIMREDQLSSPNNLTSQINLTHHQQFNFGELGKLCQQEEAELINVLFSYQGNQILGREKVPSFFKNVFFFGDGGKTNKLSWKERGTVPKKSITFAARFTFKCLLPISCISSSMWNPGLISCCWRFVQTEGWWIRFQL